MEIRKSGHGGATLRTPQGDNNIPGSSQNDAPSRVVYRELPVPFNIDGTVVERPLILPVEGRLAERGVKPGDVFDFEVEFEIAENGELVPVSGCHMVAVYPSTHSVAREMQREEALLNIGELAAFDVYNKEGHLIRSKESNPHAQGIWVNPREMSLFHRTAEIESERRHHKHHDRPGHEHKRREGAIPAGSNLRHKHTHHPHKEKEKEKEKETVRKVQHIPQSTRGDTRASRTHHRSTKALSPLPPLIDDAKVEGVPGIFNPSAPAIGRWTGLPQTSSDAGDSKAGAPIEAPRRRNDHSNSNVQRNSISTTENKRWADPSSLLGRSVAKDHPVIAEIVAAKEKAQLQHQLAIEYLQKAKEADLKVREYLLKVSEIQRKLGIVQASVKKAKEAGETAKKAKASKEQMERVAKAIEQVVGAEESTREALNVVIKQVQVKRQDICNLAQEADSAIKDATQALQEAHNAFKRIEPSISKAAKIELAEVERIVGEIPGVIVELAKLAENAKAEK